MRFTLTSIFLFFLACHAEDYYEYIGSARYGTGFTTPTDEKVEIMNAGNRTLFLAWSVTSRIAITHSHDMNSYEKIVKFTIPTTITANEKGSNEGKPCDDNNYFVLVDVECIKGACNMPDKMYTGSNFNAVCYDSAFGLVHPGSSGNSQCDWAMDGQGFQSIYLPIPNKVATSTCWGVKDTAGRQANVKSMGLFALATREKKKTQYLSTPNLTTCPSGYKQVRGRDNCVTACKNSDYQLNKNKCAAAVDYYIRSVPRTDGSEESVCFILYPKGTGLSSHFNVWKDTLPTAGAWKWDYGIVCKKAPTCTANVPSQISVAGQNTGDGTYTLTPYEVMPGKTAFLHLGSFLNCCESTGKWGLTKYGKTACDDDYTYWHLDTSGCSVCDLLEKTEPAMPEEDLECDDNKLGDDLRTVASMQSNGWTVPANWHNHDESGSAAFFEGGVPGTAIGSLTATLHGAGEVSIDLENVINRDDHVKVFLDGVAKVSLKGLERKTITFSFTDGQSLELREYFTRIRVHSVKFNCKVDFDLVDQCWCWGDPHCIPFGTTTQFNMYTPNAQHTLLRVPEHDLEIIYVHDDNPSRPMIAKWWVMFRGQKVLAYDCFANGGCDADQIPASFYSAHGVVKKDIGSTYMNVWNSVVPWSSGPRPATEFRFIGAGVKLFVSTYPDYRPNGRFNLGVQVTKDSRRKGANWSGVCIDPKHDEKPAQQECSALQSYCSRYQNSPSGSGLIDACLVDAFEKCCVDGADPNTCGDALMGHKCTADSQCSDGAFCDIGSGLCEKRIQDCPELNLVNPDGQGFVREGSNYGFENADTTGNPRMKSFGGTPISEHGTVIGFRFICPTHATFRPLIGLTTTRPHASGDLAAAEKQKLDAGYLCNMGDKDQILYKSIGASTNQVSAEIARDEERKEIKLFNGRIQWISNGVVVHSEAAPAEPLYLAIYWEIGNGATASIKDLGYICARPECRNEIISSEGGAVGAGWSFEEVTNMGTAGNVHGPFGDANKVLEKSFKVPDEAQYCRIQMTVWSLGERKYGQEDSLSVDGKTIWKKETLGSADIAAGATCETVGWNSSPSDFGKAHIEEHIENSAPFTRMTCSTRSCPSGCSNDGWCYCTGGGDVCAAKWNQADGEYCHNDSHCASGKCDIPTRKCVAKQDPPSCFSKINEVVECNGEIAVKFAGALDQGSSAGAWAVSDFKLTTACNQNYNIKFRTSGLRELTKREQNQILDKLQLTKDLSDISISFKSAAEIKINCPGCAPGAIKGIMREQLASILGISQADVDVMRARRTRRLMVADEFSFTISVQSRKINSATEIEAKLRGNSLKQNLLDQMQPHGVASVSEVIVGEPETIVEVLVAGDEMGGVNTARINVNAAVEEVVPGLALSDAKLPGVEIKRPTASPIVTESPIITTGDSVKPTDMETTQDSRDATSAVSLLALFLAVFLY